MYFIINIFIYFLFINILKNKKLTYVEFNNKKQNNKKAIILYILKVA